MKTKASFNLPCAPLASLTSFLNAPPSARCRPRLVLALHDKRYRSRTEAKHHIFHYIESFYDRRRRQYFHLITVT
jgi:hypothetical protein